MQKEKCQNQHGIILMQYIGRNRIPTHRTALKNVYSRYLKYNIVIIKKVTI